jgi:radical SAM protein with 4Fe4S-binding SPASM domain
MSVARVSSILFEAETRCSLSCIFCYNCWNAVPGYPRGKLSTRRTIAMLRKAVKESGAAQVAVTGGEPLLREDLPDIVAALTLGGTVVSVLTNGTLMTKEWASDLLKTGVRLFQLTLLGMDGKLHDAHCGEGSFAAVMRSLDILRSAGASVTFTVVVTRRTVDELPAIMAFLKKEGVSSFLLNRYNPGGRALREGEAASLLLTRQDTERMLVHAEEGARSLGIAPSASVPIPPCVADRSRYPHVAFAGCAAATDMAYFTLDPLGNIRACNHSPIILGNILATPFSEIANGDGARAWISTRPAHCVPCPGWEMCKGGCRAVCQQMGRGLDCLDPYVAFALGHGDLGELLSPGASRSA